MMRSPRNHAAARAAGHKAWATYFAGSLFLLFVFAPNLFFLYTYLSRTKAWDWAARVQFSFGLLTFALISIAIPLTLCRRYRSYFYAFAPLALISPAILLSVSQFGVLPSQGLFLSVFSSNWRELLEVVRLTGGLTLVPIAALIIYMATLHLTPAMEFEVSTKVKRWVLWGSLPLVLLGVCYLRFGYLADRFEPWVTPSTFSEAYPFGLFVKAADTFNLLTQEEEYLAFRYVAATKSAASKNQTYVLVLGETARFDHWQIYGYQRPTTPRLAALKRPELVPFGDFSSSGTLTALSLPMLLTGTDPSSFDQSYKRKSVVSAFREAGFATFWLSAQGRFLKYSSEAHQEWYPNEEGEGAIYDTDTLIMLNRWLAATDVRRKLVVLHTLGSHADYDRRYPPTWGRFTPDYWPRITGRVDRTPVINAYDNSVLYTDHFLAELIELLRKRNELSTMLYVADHGEQLFDDHRQLYSHGTANGSRAETHIPFLVWTSERYRQARPEKVRNLAANSSAKASHANVLPTLLDLADIRTKFDFQQRSLASDRYVEPQQREVLLPDRRVAIYEELR